VRLLVASGEMKGRKLGHDRVVLSLDNKRKRKPKRKKGERSDEGKCAELQGLPNGNIS
jgi:hypothetical protein